MIGDDNEWRRATSRLRVMHCAVKYRVGQKVIPLVQCNVMYERYHIFWPTLYAQATKTVSFALLAASCFLPTPTAVAVVRFSHPFVCVSVCLFFTISQKPMQLGWPNLTQKCFTISLGNPIILRLKGQRSRWRVTTSLPTWVFALLWMLASSR